jgi:hypothetical protein
MARRAGSVVAVYTAYSQRDLRWCWKKIGQSSKRFYHYGCLVTCLAMLVSMRPDELNDVLLAAGAFTGPNLDPRKAAAGLGLDYQGKEPDVRRLPTIFPTLREVDYTRGGGAFVRHFVLQVQDEGGGFYLLDPYGGVKRPLEYYRFVSYRLFSRGPATTAPGEFTPVEGRLKGPEGGGCEAGAGTQC